MASRSILVFICFAFATSIRNLRTVTDHDGKKLEDWALPEVVPRGHFAALTKNVSDVPKFVPAVVPAGTLNPANIPKDVTPAHKPEMVEHGYFEQERIRSHFAANAAKLGPISEQKNAACVVLSQTLNLARSVYEMESDPAFSNSKAIVGLVKNICPLLKARFPDAAVNISCIELESRVDQYYDPKYKGTIVPIQKFCSEAVLPSLPGKVINYALSLALRDVEAFFGLTFCPKSKFCDATVEDDYVAHTLNGVEKNLNEAVASREKKLAQIETHEADTMDIHPTSASELPKAESDLAAVQRLLIESEKHLAEVKAI